MNTLVDPRPIDPPSFYAVEPPNRASWTIFKTRWVSGVKTESATKDEGDTRAFLTALAEMLKGRDYECTIVIDAKEIVPREDSENPVYFSIDVPDWNVCQCRWVVNNVIGATEMGTDPGDLFDWIEYQFNERKFFTVELSEDDPTPLY
jgi:hypothetical protein